MTMEPSREPIATLGPYGVVIHTGRRNDRPHPLVLRNRWCYVLCGIWNGNARLYSLDEGDRCIEGPAALLLPPGQDHVLEAPPAAGWECLHFDVVHVERRRLWDGQPTLTHVTPAAQPPPEQVWGCCPPLVVSAPQRDAALDTLRACGWLWWRQPGGALRANARLASWLAVYVTASMGEPASTAGTASEPWLQRLRETALSGLETGITVAGLAAAMGMCREALRQRLWQTDRETPGNLLKRLRFDRAKAELARGRTTVRQVARYCGYRSVTAFSNAFRRATGSPPGAWAKAQR
ncbi:MAG: helix-turn-helix domain-containing protein [Armatimonadia bacterium]|nr:helix-turn-helix domain-containing protein [Armatimonadia bacterium]